MGTSEADFVESLSSGTPLEETIRRVPDVDVPAALAEHFKAGRFVGFRFAEEMESPHMPEVPE